MARARSMSSQEMMERLSQLRLGADLGILKGITKKDINEMMILGQPAFVAEGSSESENPGMRDWHRAAMLRKKMKAFAEVNDND